MNKIRQGKRNEREACPIQLHEHYIDDNGFDFWEGTRYTILTTNSSLPKRFRSFGTCWPFWIECFSISEMSRWMILVVTIKSCKRVNNNAFEKRKRRERRKKNQIVHGCMSIDVECWHENKRIFNKHKPWARWTISTIYLAHDHVYHQ